MAIDREVYPASVRGYYGLPIDSDGLSNLKSEADKLTAAQNILTSEADRVAAGGAPMVNPSAAGVEAGLNQFKTLQQTQSQLK